MNLSRTKYLVFLSSLIAILFPLVNIYYILPSFKEVIISNAEEDAERIVQYLARIIVSDGRMLENLQEQHRLLEELKEPLNLENLKFFSPDGTIVYSSDPEEIGTVNTKDYFHNLVAKGQKFTDVVEKDSGRTQEGRPVTRAVVETYVPIMGEDGFIGAAEVYYDISDREDRINETVSRGSLATFVIIIVFLLLTNTLALTQTHRVDLSEDRLSVIYRSPYMAPIIIGILIFLAECLVMVLLNAWPDIPVVMEAILDSTLLVMILAPVFYFFVVRPLMKHIEERRSVEKALKKAKEDADKANEAKSRFVANISHEIRTPMNHIIGMAGIARDREDRPQQKEALSIIESSAGSLLAIINDILDFSKIEAGRVELEQIDFSLDRLLDEVAGMFAESARGKGLTFRLLTDDEVPPRIVGDPTRLRQILVNLVNNAVKFTERGEVVVRTELAQKEQERVRVCFSISDTGLGISDAEARKLFTSFTQADSSTTRRFGGTGLGLALSKKFVEMMGGRIELDSLPGEGSTFRFTLPFRLPERDSTPSQVREEPLADYRFRNTRVLLVEDNEINQRMTRIMLEGTGARIDVAADGRECIRALEKAAYDLILMDVQMPVLDGFQATRIIRADERFRTLPIIAITASAMAGDREKCLEAGMDDYVAKPMETRELRSKIAVWLPPDKVETVGVEQESLPISSRVKEGLDLAAVIRRTGIGREALVDLLGDVRQRYGRAPEEWRDLLDRGDREGARRYAHTLKGMAGTLSAEGVRDLCSRMERTLGGEPTENEGELTEALAREWARVLEAIGPILDLEKGQSFSTGSAPESPSPDLKAEAQRLLRLLRDNDMEAEDCFRTLAPQLARLGPEQTRNLQAAIRDLDFKKADQVLTTCFSEFFTTGGEA